MNVMSSIRLHGLPYPIVLRSRRKYLLQGFGRRAYARWVKLAEKLHTLYEDLVEAIKVVKSYQVPHHDTKYKPIGFDYEQ